MLLRTLLFFSVLIVGFASCEDENSLSQPNIPSNLDAVHYDDGNIDAPLLPPGSYESAVKFPASFISQYQNKEIKELHFYIQDIPNTCQVKIYSSFQGQNSPTNLLYSESIVSSISSDSWNKHVLNQPVIIEDDDLWVSVAYTSNRDNRTVGCDPGPASENGDWIWDAALGSWELLRTNSTLNIDWNIRMAIEP